MKRITAAFFILLANMVLFVHAVIPHHHHDSDLCFDAIVAEHTSHDECCNNTCDAKHHQHDSDKESDSCMLSHIVALSNGEIKQNIRTTISSHDLINNVSLFAIKGDENSRVSNPRFFIEIVFNDHIPIYHTLASQAFGLRAPPVSC
ncbi:MAG TPA: hypothetical protein PK335_09460 [Draconibacterium sp.]|nr:hypothetical protein [Draconibacterium sp.]